MSERRDELRANLLDPMSRRPWLDEDGKSRITVRMPHESGDLVLMSRESPITARLTKAQWIQADTAILKAFRERAPLTCWLMHHGTVKDERAAGLAKMALEDEEMTDPGEAIIDGPLPSRSFGLPLPITHCDIACDLDAELKARSGKVGKLHMADGTVKEEPINVTREGLFENHFLFMCEAAGRRVGEAVERTLFDGWGEKPWAKVFGLTNCGKPIRFGGTIQVADAVKLLSARKFYGPFVVVTDADINTYEQRKADRGNLLAVEGVQAIIATPALKPGESVILQCTPDVVRIVVGLDPVLMQWDEGFKVACCIVPQVRCDLHGNVGVAVRR